MITPIQKIAYLQLKRYLVLLIVLLSSFSLHAQGFTGYYSSNYTTYKDDVNSNNNFKENSLFYIGLNIEEGDSGWVSVQDSRTLDDVLIFEIKSFLDVIQTEERSLLIYQAYTAHFPESEDTKLVLYFNKNGDVNLMINFPNTSQTYYNLTEVKQQ